MKKHIFISKKQKVTKFVFSYDRIQKNFFLKKACAGKAY